MSIHLRTNSGSQPRGIPRLRSPVPMSDAVGDHDRFAEASSETLFIVDCNLEVFRTVRAPFERRGYSVEFFPTCSSFLDSHHKNRLGCLLVDSLMLGISDIDLIALLAKEGNGIPSIVMSRDASLRTAVQSMRAGAFDCIQKPIQCEDLMTIVKQALDLKRDASAVAAFRGSAVERVANLTVREKQILHRVTAGQPSKNIAADLGISQRTVENHRAKIANKTGAKSFAGVVQTALCAECALNINASQSHNGRIEQWSHHQGCQSATNPSLSDSL